jgi:pimeloyl-ACP methyl ester carboxylesterase
MNQKQGLLRRPAEVLGWVDAARRRCGARVSLTVGQFLTLLLLSWLGGCDTGKPFEAVIDGEAPSADGVVIRYDVRGAGDTALVLVHGWANTRAVWGVHPETLARRHRVVALDLAGHGRSGADRADWTMGAFGEDIVAVVDQLGLERVVLVGFSMGAAAVLEAAERLGDRVVGVVFVDMFHDPDAVMSGTEREQFVTMMRTNWRDTAFIRAFAFTPDAQDSLLTHVRTMMPEQPHEYYFTALKSALEWMGSDLRSMLQRADRPIAAINTTSPPTNVEALLRYAPSFTVDTIGGVGHAGILLRRVTEFDGRLLAIVERFATGQRSK